MLGFRNSGTARDGVARGAQFKNKAGRMGPNTGYGPITALVWPIWRNGRHHSAWK